MRGTLRRSARIAGALVVVFVVMSLVPGEEVYYRLERLLSYAGPLGSGSQHLRSFPSTTGSILAEAFQGHKLEVEGVSVNLNHAVNPSEYVEDVRFTSRVLGEERTYWVYLPPGYADSDSRYPTLYLLHGMSQGHRWWAEVARIDRIATAMIEAGKIKPLIMVMPNGNRVEHDPSTTSLYDNGCETGLDIIARGLKELGDRFNGLAVYKVSCDGDFEDYVVHELVRDVDSRYRTNGERYVGGFSIGARGAFQLALRNSGVFDGAFGLSGNYDFLRDRLRDGGIGDTDGMKLFLGSGSKDQRGVYGRLNTFLFHKDLAGRRVDHLYCIYDGSHSDVAWVSAMPIALQYLLPPETAPLNGEVERHACR